MICQNHSKNANFVIFNHAKITSCEHVNIIRIFTSKPLTIKIFYESFHLGRNHNWATKCSGNVFPCVEDNEYSSFIFGHCFPSWLTSFFLELVIVSLTTRLSSRKSDFGDGNRTLNGVEKINLSEVGEAEALFGLVAPSSDLPNVATELRSSFSPNPGERTIYCSCSMRSKLLFIFLE